MLFRTITGELTNIKRNDYTTDKEYYLAIKAIKGSISNIDKNIYKSTEAMKIANIVKTQVYKTNYTSV
jgi:hypothetical protein